MYDVTDFTKCIHHKFCSMVYGVKKPFCPSACAGYEEYTNRIKYVTELTVLIENLTNCLAAFKRCYGDAIHEGKSGEAAFRDGQMDGLKTSIGMVENLKGLIEQDVKKG